MTKSGLNKREKTLIFIALLLLLIYLVIQFAIYPLFNRYVDSVQERIYLTTEKAQVEADIANLASIEEANTVANEKFERIVQEYPLLIPNEEIDRILTDMCISNGLKPTALRFTDSFGVPNSSDQKDDQYLFTVVVASMSMTGRYDSMVKLIDDVADSQFINISNLGYTVNNSTSGDEETANITMAFELTFINP